MLGENEYPWVDHPFQHVHIRPIQGQFGPNKIYGYVSGVGCQSCWRGGGELHRRNMLDYSKVSFTLLIISIAVRFVPRLAKPTKIDSNLVR